MNFVSTDGGPRGSSRGRFEDRGSLSLSFLTFYWNRYNVEQKNVVLF